MNLFIEGIQGMGKSTLLQKMAVMNPEYNAYREGDYCEVELAWCTYMTENEYNQAINKYPMLEAEIRQRTVIEDDHYIVCYTRIITDEPGFHKYMEQYEIYNGRKSLKDFRQIIFKRYNNLSASDKNGIYECALFQNIIEELILYQQLSDDEICMFYRELFELIKDKEFRLIYLYSDKVEENISHIRSERSDNSGNQMWYKLMMAFLKESPYGRAHGWQGFEDMVGHFKHRQAIELRIIKEILGDHAFILTAKEYTDADLERICKSL